MNRGTLVAGAGGACMVAALLGLLGTRGHVSVSGSFDDKDAGGAYVTYHQGGIVMVREYVVDVHCGAAYVEFRRLKKNGGGRVLAYGATVEYVPDGVIPPELSETP